jgi:DNA-binding transcriptional LysR family regulator
MNLTHLRTFQVVAELRHFAKAADRCNLSQPAVSHQIAQLEEDVGAKLFNRSGRTVSLTVVGEVLLEETHRVLSTLDRADERVREAARGAIGRIRFGVTPTAGLYLLGELITEYQQRHPAYELHLEIAQEGDLLDRVVRNELDMAVLAGDIPTSDLRAIPIAEDHLVAVASPSLKRRAGTRLNLDELLREVTWLLREPGSDTRRQVDRWFERQKFTPVRTLTLTGPDAVKRAAEAGLGVGIISKRCVEKELTPKVGLAILPIAPELPMRRYSLVDHRHKHHGAACRAMLAMLLPPGEATASLPRKLAAQPKNARQRVPR